MHTKTLCLGALALGLSVIGAPGAQAAPPQHIEQFHDEFTEVHGLLSALCGFTVMVDHDVRGTFRHLADDSIHVTEQGRRVLSNPDNGLTLTNAWNINVKAHGTETFNDDGTLTIVFDDRITGIPARWLDHDGKTLIKDRGSVRFVGEAHIDLHDPDDPDDDELLAFEEEVVFHGPHPIIEDGLDPSLACVFLS